MADLLKKKLRVVGDMMKTASEVFIAVKNAHTISGSYGAQLDEVGRQVGESRNAEGDPDFRVRIERRIRLNLSQGEPDLVIEAAQAEAAGHEIHMSERFPAGIEIEANGTASLEMLPSDICRRVERYVGAGIELRFRLVNSLGEYLTFAAEGSATPRPGLPYGEGFVDGTGAYSYTSHGGYYPELFA